MAVKNLSLPGCYSVPDGSRKLLTGMFYKVLLSTLLSLFNHHSQTLPNATQFKAKTQRTSVGLMQVVKSLTATRFVKATTRTYA